MAKKKAVSAKQARGSKKEQGQVSAQMMAVILLACAILFMCILLIPGASLWNWLHNLLFGLFGFCAFLVPPIAIYVSILLAKEKDDDSVRRRVLQGILLLFTVGSTVHIFAADVTENYFAALVTAFKDGTHLYGAGVCGALLGYVFEWAFSDIGAKIILLLALFVVIMVVTKTSVLTLFKAPAKVVKKARERVDTEGVAIVAKKKEKQAYDHEKEKRPAAIDVDMGEGYVGEAAEEPAPKKRRARKAEEPVAEVSAVPSGVDDSISGELSEAAEQETMPTAYRYPPISLLREVKPQNVAAAQQEQQQTADLLVKTLNDFGVSARVIAVSRGPSVTRYELEPSAGVKLSKITGLADDIALRLATTGVRIEAPIPNKAAVGIEVPNRNRVSIGLREMIDAPDFSLAKSKLTVALGRDIAGNTVYTDLAKMPHLLIAGTTGSGKSVCTNMMIQSVLFRASPEEVRLLLIDPKMVEFGVYNGIPHLLVPVVTDPRKAAGALGWAVTEMLARYKAFAENNVRNLEEYNRLAQKSDTVKAKPQILILIDELADLMMAAKNEVEDAIVRLAQMARAAGMHLVIATQRPSVDVITGLIKANIPSRLALTVASSVDSRTILDCGGAEKLLGRGDMLFMPLGMSKPMRIQGGYVDMEEIEAVVDFLKDEGAEEIYDDEIMQEIERQASAAGKKDSAAADDDGDDEPADDMLPQAIEVVIDAGMASTSLLQRKLRLGYARAGRIVDEMERRGIVGPHEGSKPRQVLITRQQWMEMNALRDDISE
ncbi:MAG: DNA translocase FtsK [Ruminococcaceae bacterium]|nr:DNA translocase FtsK [Oscillospiraceae bacterium]